MDIVLTKTNFFLILRTILTTADDKSFLERGYVNQIQWDEIYFIFTEHVIAPIASNIIKYIPEENSELVKNWKQDIYSNIFNFSRISKQQKHIIDFFIKTKIPVVVLKGTSAAKYYPKPQLRTMGDIDLLVKPLDYERAVCYLTELGCHETTSQAEVDRGRHKSFLFDDIEIELHAFFSSKGMDADEANALDELLFNAIPDNDTVLPDDENGLVLLSHIRQHLEGGIGLRQIIDWFMFVKAYLDDDVWFSSFQEKVRIIGLEKLAITVTKMCQIYLGLSTEKHTWCEDADITVCKELMQYVMECGNFGRKRERIHSRGGFPSIKHPIILFKYIQSHGKRNWKALQSYPWLCPFAWIYQSCHYINFAIQNKMNPEKLKDIYDESQKRNAMFAALGLK